MVSLAELNTLLDEDKKQLDKADTNEQGRLTAADVDAMIQSRVIETPEEQALRLGAKPGVALTPEQQQKLAGGEPIQAAEPTLGGRDLQPVPEQEKEGAFGRSFEQGLLNIGGGILRGVGELRKAIGDEDADKFLQDLGTSQAMELARTAEATKDAPIAAFAGEVLGETAGFGVGGPGKSLFQRLAGEAVVSATGGALSAAGRGEEDIAGEAIIAAALSPAAEAVGFFRNKFKLRGESKAAEIVTKQELATSQVEGQKIAEKTGIDLLPAQKSLDPFDIERQSFLGQNPEVSGKAFKVLTRQNEQAAKAVGTLLDQIAAPESVGTSSELARKAAGNIINEKVIIRKEKSSPIYNAAFGQAQAEGKRVDVQPVIDSINTRLENFAEVGPSGKLLQRVKQMIGGPDVDEEIAEGIVTTPNIERANLRRMHNVKMEIDELISREKNKGNLGPTVEAELFQIQKEFVGQMDALGVGYDNARAEFARLSPAIDELKAGVFGRLSTINDRSLKQASSVLFDAAETNPQVMKKAIASLKGVEGGQDIARALLRTELEKRLGRLPPGTEEGSREALENIPGKLNKAIFGNAKQRNLFFAALEELSPEAKKNAEWLERGLFRAGRGRPGGSQTAIRKVITEDLERGVVNSLKNIFVTPKASLETVGREAARAKNAKALGDALYNPDWAPDMKIIRNLPPNSPKAGTLFTGLLNKIISFGEEAKLTGRAAPVAARVATREENE